MAPPRRELAGMGGAIRQAAARDAAPLPRWGEDVQRTIPNRQLVLWIHGSRAAQAHRCGILAARGDAVPEYDLLLHHWLRYRRAGRLSAAGKATQTLPAGRAGQARRQQTISARRPGRGA